MSNRTLQHLAPAVVLLALACTAAPGSSGRQVVVEPRTAQLAAGGAQAFTAAVSGLVDTTVTWTVTEAGGGQVDSTGHYTAPSGTGQFHVVAASNADPSVRGVAVVTVAAAPALSIAISPKTASVIVGNTATFQATVTGSADTAVVWSVREGAAGGSVSGGVYTPPGTAGIYHVVAAAHANGGVTDEAAVTVVPAGSVVTPGSPGAADVQVVINSTVTKPISRFVYGLNDVGSGWGTLPQGMGFSRLGGNALNTYNWETGFTNSGADYFYWNQTNLVGDGTPGSAMRGAVNGAAALGAGVALTVPIAGWVSADGNNTAVATPFPNLSRFLPILGKNPSATDHAAAIAGSPSKGDGKVYQDDMVGWVDRTFPGAVTDPVKPVHFLIDNEPDLWNSTHAEIWGSAPPTWAQVTQRNIDTAKVIKDTLPNAVVYGPECATWTCLVNLTFPRDTSSPAYASYEYYVGYYLDQLKAASQAYGKRLVDVFSWHFYTDQETSDGQDIKNMYASNSPMENADSIQARVQAPRSLWDPTFKENSFITLYDTIPNCPGCGIALLTRMQQQIDQHWPGTKMAITEYYYGNAEYVSGGIAQADVLGIFGAQGVYAATTFPIRGPYTCLNKAFHAFLNYDGAGGKFGDLSSSTAVTDPQKTAAIERVSAYGSADSSGPGRAVVVAINKSQASLTAGIAVTHQGTLTRAEVYQVKATGAATATGCTNPTRAADLAAVATNAFKATLPPLSISVFVLKP